MNGLVFIGIIGPDSHNLEEERFVEEHSRGFSTSVYLRGVGVKGLRWHHFGLDEAQGRDGPGLELTLQDRARKALTRLKGERLEVATR